MALFDKTKYMILVQYVISATFELNNMHCFIAICNSRNMQRDLDGCLLM